MHQLLASPRHANKKCQTKLPDAREQAEIGEECATGTIMAPENGVSMLAILDGKNRSKDNIAHTTADLNCADIDLSST
jgi:hypothetical protein